MNRHDYEEAAKNSEAWQSEFTLGDDLQWHEKQPAPQRPEPED
jgi:hypothetical protein